MKDRTVSRTPDGKIFDIFKDPLHGATVCCVNLICFLRSFAIERADLAGGHRHTRIEELLKRRGMRDDLLTQTTPDAQFHCKILRIPFWRQEKTPFIFEKS